MVAGSKSHWSKIALSRCFRPSSLESSKFEQSGQKRNFPIPYIETGHAFSDSYGEAGLAGIFCPTFRVRNSSKYWQDLKVFITGATSTPRFSSTFAWVIVVFVLMSEDFHELIFPKFAPVCIPHNHAISQDGRSVHSMRTQNIIRIQPENSMVTREHRLPGTTVPKSVAHDPFISTRAIITILG